MWSSNLLKGGFTTLQADEKRVIDVNAMMELRMEQWAEEMARSRGEETGEWTADEQADGFLAGLSAEQIEGLTADGEQTDGAQSNVIKANAEAARDSLLSEAQEAADEIVAQAREEAESLIAQARAQIESEKEQAFAQAREQGYAEGFEQAGSEFAEKEQELARRRTELEAEYEKLIEQLEPRFVDAITGVYEHLFRVELSSYRDILLHLIESCVRRVEGGRDFLVHVSKEDYPYVSMEKKQLSEALTSPGATLELVEDITLKHNECMIETEGGIYDCGLGTQLLELTQRLKLLSYEKR